MGGKRRGCFRVGGAARGFSEPGTLGKSAATPPYEPTR
jgi:hypothetical protein